MATIQALTEFQKFIRKRRLQLEINQLDVARAVNVNSAEFIALVESGKRNIQLERVYKLADVLKVNRQDLIKLALYEQLPMTYRVLFGDQPPPGTARERTRTQTRSAQLLELFSILNEEQQERLMGFLHDITRNSVTTSNR